MEESARGTGISLGFITTALCHPGGTLNVVEERIVVRSRLSLAWLPLITWALGFGAIFIAAIVVGISSRDWEIVHPTTIVESLLVVIGLGISIFWRSRHGKVAIEISGSQVRVRRGKFVLYEWDVAEIDSIEIGPYFSISEWLLDSLYPPTDCLPTITIELANGTHPSIVDGPRILMRTHTEIDEANRRLAQELAQTKSAL